MRGWRGVYTDYSQVVVTPQVTKQEEQDGRPREAQPVPPALPSTWPPSHAQDMACEGHLTNVWEEGVAGVGGTKQGQVKGWPLGPSAFSLPRPGGAGLPSGFGRDQPANLSQLCCFEGETPPFCSRYTEQVGKF